MKSILLSIKPEWLCKILNGEKTIEVRKNKALANAIRELIKQYGKALIYMYCSKNDNLCRISKISQDRYICGKDFDTRDFPHLSSGYEGKGKVVARFWCDKVENVGRYNVFEYGTETITPDNFNSMTCLRDDQIREYLGNSKKLFAIHISKLEIFDKPKELNEFWTCGKQVRKGVFNYSIIHKAPQNYCYVEVE